MRRKLLLVLTAILLVFCLAFAACGENRGNSNQTTPEQNGGQTPEHKDDSPSDRDTQSGQTPNDKNDESDEKNESPSQGQESDKKDEESDKKDDDTDKGGDKTQESPVPTQTLTFEQNGEGYFVTGDSGESSSIVIPETHEGKPVIGIGESAFAYSKHTSNILSVTIPDSVTAIEKNAFYSRDELTEVKIGEGSRLAAIGNNAFSGCGALTEIFLPATVAQIGDAAFNNCGGLNVISVASGNTHYSGEGNNLIDLATQTLIRGSNRSEIPETVTKIGDAAFRRATLTTLTIPSSVTSIGKYIIQDSAIVTIIYKGTAKEWENAIKDTSKSWNMGKRDVAVKCSDTEDEDEKGDSKILVAYFSCTGNTQKIAEYIAEVTGGTLYEITPKEPYTSADLNYNTDCRANREQNDDKARPEIEGSVENMEEYDVVYLGYPIWWGEAPKIIYTFLESYDFSDKTIVPFCTSGSSPVGSSATHLHNSASEAIWVDGKRFSASSAKESVSSWIDGLSFSSKK